MKASFIDVNTNYKKTIAIIAIANSIFKFPELMEYVLI